MATGEADIAIGDGIIGSLAGRRNQVVKVVEVAVEAVGVVQSTAASATRKESPQGRQRFVVMRRKDVRSGAVVGSGRRVIVLVLAVVRAVMTTATAKGRMIQRVVAATGTTSMEDDDEEGGGGGSGARLQAMIVHTGPSMHSAVVL
ncbi:hypothetical protein TYRP_009319 [Tyrophagus putrescentiae]|nr:hypothetical protein TYRP_009319 [Tyrophagus putrescentiae]